MSDKTPHSIELERALLGALLSDPQRLAWVTARRTLEYGAETFWGERHRAIWRALEAVCEGDPAAGISGAPADPVLLYDELARRGDLERAGGAAYLARLSGEALPGSVETYCRGLNNYAIRRATLAALADLTAEAQTGAQDIEGYLSRAASVVASLRPKAARTALSARELAKDYFARQDARPDGEPAPGVVPTPFERLNELLGGGGLPVGLTVVAGATGMGKSVMALRLAVHAALAGRKVEIYTTEMSSAQTFDRALAQTARVSRRDLDRGEMTAAQNEAVMDAIQRLAAAPLWVEDDPRLTSSKICARALHRSLSDGLDLLVVDYFQRVPVDDSPRNARRSQAENLAQAAQAYQQLARDLQIPILIVSQVTDEVIKDKRAPRPSDTKDCRALGHEAGAFLGVHRPAWYGEEAPRGRKGQEMEPVDQSLLEVHVQGKRDCKQGVVRLRWEGDRHGIDAREDRYREHNLREVY